ncbi:glutathione peroxidase [Treponema putidum]|uniref:glutathione peroxidase n=1 Tax=Treponema putidum TaxID=221027 RepID=UPI0004F84D16|nr:glutathione peroxidase [Treponema putidum]AIN93395.1 glutathione peroxidase [Treponema putidum]TWI74465.1 glutathione peroxidase [Treponema putidum]UTY32107.1 glutathione peroxidase [Treponema putidum]
MTIYDYSVQDAQGRNIPLKDYKGKVLLIVNTATKCGFTPHYKELEQMYEKYHEQGLEIIDVPCNQFGEQAPGTNEQISEFCSLNYNTKFPQMKKSDVNGTNELPLYTYLKAQKKFESFGEGKTAQMMDNFLAKIDPDYKNNSDIKWNFTKFIAARDGSIAARFEPTAPMTEIEACIAKLI